MKYTSSENLKATMRKHGICVVIPTYNNAGTLKHVVSETQKYCDDVFVVNDGSTDETQNILASIPGIEVISYLDNKGKGAALKYGFLEAKKAGFKYAMTIDSDGQHYPENIEDFVKAIIENPEALIIGQRDLSNVDINGKSSFANKFSNFWFCVQTGKRLKDTQTGFRAYPLNKLYGMSLLTSRYEAELELLVFAAWNGVEIVSIPIKVYYPPQAERISHFKPALDFTRISILNTILCFVAIIYGLPKGIIRFFSKSGVFNRELKLFTHKKGRRKDAATTIGRLVRSIYGFTFFLFFSLGVFVPVAMLLSIGNKSPKKKLLFHKMLRGISDYMSKHFPGAETSYYNFDDNTFEKPALVICNHQSHLDLPILMALNPKLIFLTKDWVWNNFFIGRIVRQADFLPTSAGIETILPKLKTLCSEGYSIVVFPEGTRSEDNTIGRFHQGAFYLANELGLDVIPLVLHGAGDYLPKNDFMFRRGNITLKALDRQINANIEQDLPVRKVASYYRRLIVQEYDAIARVKEKSMYFKHLVLYKYAYRGWEITSHCKSVLKALPKFSNHIDDEDSKVKTIRILNSGIGVFALMYALVNKDVEVYAFVESLKEYKIATNTASLPDNLHYVHAVWLDDYEQYPVKFDKTIHLSNGLPKEQI